MAKREFLMLAHDYEANKHGLAGYYASEKLDGIRCFWDGGITRGLAAELVPWANTAKHARYKIPPVCTGLWTRYGQPIQCLPEWLDTLPPVPLDGELTMGRGTFQETLSCVRSLEPDRRWKEVRYALFDTPPYTSVFANGRINNTNYKKEFQGILNWGPLIGKRDSEVPFYKAYASIGKLSSPYIYAHKQELLPASTPAARERLQVLLDEVVKLGGEGIMLRSPVSFWRPERTYDLLKVKPWHDCEVTVLGYKWGQATDTERCVSGQATNRMVGLMGSMKVRMNGGVVFDLGCGFTLQERELVALPEADPEEGSKNPGKEVSIGWTSNKFPIGSRITIRYRELTKDGVPKEARYWRHYEEA